MSRWKFTASIESAPRHALSFLAALASVMLLTFYITDNISIEPRLFYLLHNLLEIFGIIIAAMIFVISWMPLENSRSNRSVILASAFFGLAAIELGHVVTFDGIFAQSLSHPTEISVRLMMAGQSLGAIALLNFTFGSTQVISKRNAYFVLFAVLSMCLVIYSVVVVSTNDVPTTLNNKLGVTWSTIAYEAFIGTLYLITGLTLFRRSIQKKSYLHLTIATAAIILSMSVLVFTHYSYSNDLSNLLGHLYKLAAYVLLYRAIVFKGIKQPYSEIKKLKQRFEATLDALPDLVFETSLEGIIHEYHSDPNRSKLLSTPAEFIGRNIAEFLPPLAVQACKNALQETSLSGNSYGQQYSIMERDGEHHYEISASKLEISSYDIHYVMIVRDISVRHSLTQRLASLLRLAEQSEGIDEKQIARLGLDILETLTQSRLSFLHLLNDNEKEIELSALGSKTEEMNRQTNHHTHNGIDFTAIFSQIIKKRAPITLNNYEGVASNSDRAEDEIELNNFVAVPIFEHHRIGMIIGVANANYLYSETTISTVELFGTELYQIIQRRRAQFEAEKNHLLLSSALENLPVGVAITRLGDNPKFEYFNKQFPLLFGVDPSAVNNVNNFWNAAIEDETDRDLLHQKMEDDFGSGQRNRLCWERIPIQRGGHIVRYLNMQTVPVNGTDLSVTLAEDVSEAMHNEEEIRIAASAFSSQEGILITDASLRIQRVNEAFERSSGYSSTELIGKTPLVLLSGDHNDAYYRRMWAGINEQGVWRGEVRNKNKDGSTSPYSITISAVKDSLGKISHYVADYIDLSAIKSAQETISRLSYFDTLTGLPNREHMKEILEDQKQQIGMAMQYIGALMIDLDNFKIINETLGHDAGDLLLVQVVKRIQASLRPGDQAIRYGGDEFIILLPNLGSNLEKASLNTQIFAQSILSTLEGNYIINDSSCFSSASIGATLQQTSTLDLQELQKQLDIALSNAKEDGNNQIRFFDPAWQVSVSERAKLLEDLRNAIAEHHLELYYQPQWNERNEIVGAEALIRWHHPDKKLLPPNEFLPIAQENHLMIKLGDEVIRMGLKQLHEWQQIEDFRHLKISLNITADQFYEKRFEQFLLSFLEEYEITPGSVMLEFTESMLLDNVEAAKEKIERLNESNIEFSIDDFGTGYSSLSYLSSLKMDQLKIDQSFVRNIGVVETDALIVRAIIDMARTLKLDVIAEGVETAEQLEYLKSQGCTLFQGYLFSKPLPILEFNKLVSDSINHNKTTH